MSILENAVNQAISDFDEIQERAGIPDGTPTSEYDEYVGSGGVGVVDQVYNPESENAQSGKAVAEALSTLGNIGGEEIYVGTEAPTDDKIKIWINPNGNQGDIIAENGNGVEY